MMKRFCYEAVSILLLCLLVPGMALLAQEPGTIKWEFKTEGAIQSPPAIADDGTIYVGSDDHLYAVNPDGSLLWKYQAGDSVQTSPAIDSEGTIYFGSKDGNIYAMNKDGSLKWDYKTNGAICTSPAISKEGYIFIGSKDFNLYAFDLEGNLAWTYYVDGLVHTPSIGPDGTIYVQSDSYYLYALNIDGTLSWSLRFNYKPGICPAIASDGRLHIGSWGAKLNIFYPYGEEFDKNFRQGKMYTVPILDNHNNIYFGTGTSMYYALDPIGNEKWSMDTDGIVLCSAMGEDRVLYNVTDSGNLFAVDINGTKLWDCELGGTPGNSLNLSLDSTLYIGSSDSTLYAVNCSSAGLADTPWPAMRQNSANTGSNENNEFPRVVTSVDTIHAEPHSSVELDGSGSFDPDGNELQFEWTVTTLPDGGKVDISDPQSAVSNFMLDTNVYGLYKIRLTVTDADGNKSYNHVYIDYGNLLWRFGTSDNIYSSAAIGNDGSIYCCSSDSFLYKLNPDGSLLWKYKASERSYYAPSISSDGIVYFITYPGKLYAVTSDGNLLWTFQVDDQIRSHVAIDSDGTLYFGCDDEYLYAINADGSLKWKFKAISGIRSSPSIGFNGKIYFCASQETVYALNKDGSLYWSYKIGGFISTAPAIAADGSIIISTGYNSVSKVASFTPDGELLWNRQVDGSTGDIGSPVIDKDGAIYLYADDDYFHALNADGGFRWSFKTPRMSWSTAAIGADGTIYFGSRDMFLYALNPNGSLKWKYKAENDVDAPMILSNDGILYFGTRDDKLYALQTESMGLAKSSWPTFGQNNANTSNVENLYVPVAQVENDYITAKIGETVTLDASESTDFDGDDLYFAWSLIDQPEGGLVEISDSTLANPTVTFLNSVYGEYKYLLTVTDMDDGANSTVVVINYTNQLWSCQIDHSISTSPAVLNDSTLVFTDTNGMLYAMHPDGTEQWSENISDSLLTAPVIGADETIYMGSSDNNIYALNPDGSLNWSFETNDKVTATPAIHPEGNIYVGSQDSTFYALNADGSLNWSYKTDGVITSSAAIGKYGNVYVGSADHFVYAFSPLGELIFKYETTAPVQSSPAIGENSVIYIGSDDGSLYVLNPDGSLKWTYTTDGPVKSSPVIQYGESVCVGSDDSTMYVIDADGSLLWSYKTGGPVRSVMVGADSTVYTASLDNSIYALDPRGALLWSFKADSAFSLASPVLLSDGSLYAGSMDGYFYALQTTSEGLANTPWPRFHADVKNSGMTADSQVIVSVNDDESAIITDYALFQNYPNPFNPVTVIKYALPEQAHVTLDVFNINGNLVKQLTNTTQRAGYHSFVWDGTNSNGERVATGLYFYRVKAGEFSQTRRMILMK